VSDRTFDDLYALGDPASDPAGRRLGLEAAGRRLLVGYGDGYDHAQVFAPPGAEFVCLEPMTAPTAALAAGATPLVAPGDRFAAGFTIAVEKGSSVCQHRGQHGRSMKFGCCVVLG
jgi:hypothetical protein